MYDAKQQNDNKQYKNEQNYNIISDRGYFENHISPVITNTKTSYIPRETLF